MTFSNGRPYSSFRRAAKKREKRNISNYCKENLVILSVVKYYYTRVVLLVNCSSSQLDRIELFTPW